MNKPRILLDLDCVLADFVTGGCKAHGLTVEETLPHWPAGEYAMDTAVGRALGQNGSWTFADFWRPLNDNRAFWASLDVLPWTERLLHLVCGITDDVWIVTSPSQCHQCVPGKKDWCDRIIGKHDHLIPLSHKYLLANPRTILIDDYDKNVDDFKAAGGHGVLLPAHHNSRHDLKGDPFAVVEQHLRRALQCI